MYLSLSFARFAPVDKIQTHDILQSLVTPLLPGALSGLRFALPLLSAFLSRVLEVGRYLAWLWEEALLNRSP